MKDSLFDPRDYTPPVLFQHAKIVGLKERNVRQLLSQLIGKADHNPLKWIETGIIPKRMRDQISALPRLTLERSVVSPIDGFQKLLFRTLEGFPIETVIIPLEKNGKTTVCLSSQVGCVMGCAFCATGRMTERRSLETWEIIDQFIHARALCHASGREVRGVVFMGMGEPFLNYDRVLAAADLISLPVANAIGEKAITISTVGLIQEINRFTQEQRPYRLSISLGAATDEKRARLVPVAAKNKIKDVIAAARHHALSRRDRVMLAYVCISRENVSVEDAQALGALIGDTPVRLDLIEVTDSTGRFLRPTPEEMRIFRDALTQYVGQPVARRYSGGADINAACGTLAGL